MSPTNTKLFLENQPHARLALEAKNIEMSSSWSSQSAWEHKLEAVLQCDV